MKINLTMEIEVEYVAHPEEPRTRHYPGADAEAEILEISILGIPVDELLFDAIIDEHGEEITEACLEDAQENLASDLMARAEAKWESMTNR